MTVELAEKMISALEGMQTALIDIEITLATIGILLAIAFALAVRKER